MANRWLKNLSVSSVEETGLAYYWFLRHCLDYTFITKSGGWPNEDDADIDGVILASLPTTFVTSGTHFSVGDVGKWLAVYDLTEPLNTGIFSISAFTDSSTITLSSPCDFQADASGISWVLIDPSSLPIIDVDYAVLQATIFQASMSPRTIGYSIALDPRGANFEGSTLGPVNLDATSTTLFAVGDEDYCILWSEGGANRSAIYLGNTDEAVDVDDYPTVLLGASNAAPIIDRDSTNTASIAGGGSGYYGDAIELPCHLSNMLDINSAADSFADPAFVTNPRTSASDYFGFCAVYPASGLYPKTVQGVVKSLYMVNDSIANRTTLDSDSVYVIENGVAVAWDGSVPV